MNTLSCEKIDNLQSLQALKPSWDKLHYSCVESTPFNSWSWCVNSWQHFAESSEAAVFAFFSAENCLVGIIPLKLCRRRFPPVPFHLNTLEFLVAEELGSASNDFLILEEYRGQVLEEFCSRLQTDQSWDHLRLMPFASDSPNQALLRRLLPGELSFHNQSYEVCHFITPNSWDNLLDGFSKPTRKSFRRKLKNIGPYSLRESTTETLLDDFNRFVVLSRARFKEAKLDGAFTKKEFTEFHRGHCRRLFREGRFSLLNLEVDNKTIASLYLLKDKNRWFAYQGAMNPKFQGVGALLDILAIDYGFKNCELEHYDFCQGDQNYKTSVSTGIRSTNSLRSFNNTLRGKHIASLQKIREQFKQPLFGTHGLLPS